MATIAETMAAKNEATVPTLRASITIEEGVSSKTGKPFIGLSVDTPRGSLKGLREDEWYVLHDVLPDGDFRQRLGKALVALAEAKRSATSTKRIGSF